MSDLYPVAAFAVAVAFVVGSPFAFMWANESLTRWTLARRARRRPCPDAPPVPPVVIPLERLLELGPYRAPAPVDPDPYPYIADAVCPVKVARKCPAGAKLAGTGRMCQGECLDSAPWHEPPPPPEPEPTAEGFPFWAMTPEMARATYERMAELLTAHHRRCALCIRKIPHRH